MIVPDAVLPFGKFPGEWVIPASKLSYSETLSGIGRETCLPVSKQGD
jgi:hypothetical protein